MSGVFLRNNLCPIHGARKVSAHVEVLVAFPLEQLTTAMRSCIVIQGRSTFRLYIGHLLSYVSSGKWVSVSPIGQKHAPVPMPCHKSEASSCMTKHAKMG